MRVLRDIDQGTKEWFDARCGLISASHAHEIVTPAKLSKGAANNYADRLAAERYLGKPMDTSKATQAMERGADMEAEARMWLAFDLDVDIEQVGLIVSDCGAYCASPDGVIAEAAGVEIKCRTAVPHARLVREHRKHLDDPFWYDMGARLQIQMSLWLTGWPKWVYLAYCPGFPKVVREYAPEPAVQEALSKYLPAFNERVDGMVEEMRSLEAETDTQADLDAAVWAE